MTTDQAKFIRREREMLSGSLERTTATLAHLTQRGASRTLLDKVRASEHRLRLELLNMRLHALGEDATEPPTSSRDRERAAIQ
jgi:hypothetical protein